MRRMWDADEKRKVHFLEVERLEVDEHGELWAEVTCLGKKCRFPVSRATRLGHKLVIVENLPHSPFGERLFQKSVPVCVVTLGESLSKLIKVKFKILQPDIFPLTLEPLLLSVDVLEPKIFPLTLEPVLLSMTALEPRIVFALTLEPLLLHATALAPEIFPLTLKPLLLHATVLDPDIRLLKMLTGQVLELSLDTFEPDVLALSFDASAWIFEPYANGIIEHYDYGLLDYLKPLYPPTSSEAWKGGLGLALNATSGKDFVFFRAGINPRLSEELRYSQAIVCSNVNPAYSWNYDYSYGFDIYVNGSTRTVSRPFQGVFKHPEVGSIELVENYLLISRVQNGQVVERKMYDLEGNLLAGGTVGVITAVSNASNEIVTISGLNRRLFINGQQISEHLLIGEIPTDPDLPFPAILDSGDFLWRGKPNQLVRIPLEGEPMVFDYAFADGTDEIPTVVQLDVGPGLLTAGRDYKRFYAGILNPVYDGTAYYDIKRDHVPVYYLWLPRYGRYVFL